jgi:hypothetical protein
MEYLNFPAVFNTLLAACLGWTFAQMFLVRHRLRRLERQVRAENKRVQ